MEKRDVIKPVKEGESGGETKQKGWMLRRRTYCKGNEGNRFRGQNWVAQKSQIRRKVFSFLLIGYCCVGVSRPTRGKNAKQCAPAFFAAFLSETQHPTRKKSKIVQCQRDPKPWQSKMTNAKCRTVQHLTKRGAIKL
jgi:hypothetical protein